MMTDEMIEDARKRLLTVVVDQQIHAETMQEYASKIGSYWWIDIAILAMIILVLVSVITTLVDVPYPWRAGIAIIVAFGIVLASSIKHSSNREREINESYRAWQKLSGKLDLLKTSIEFNLISGQRDLTESEKLACMKALFDSLQFDKRLIRGPIVMDLDKWKASVETVNRRHGLPVDQWVIP